MDRYDRQRRVRPPRDGCPSIDERIAATHVLLAGVGGTGGPLATALVRTGVGRLTILDPDGVSPSDLHRQPLYFPEDARAGTPKAEAAARELGRIGGRTEILALPEALTPRNAIDRIGSADIVIDGTDHLAARGWIDEGCRALGRPWIHTAAIEDRWVVIPFLDAISPCFACYCPETPPTSAIGTCETHGVLPAATQLAAAHALSTLFLWWSDQPREGGTREIERGRVGVPGVRVSRLLPDPECPRCGSGATSGTRSGLRLLCGNSRAEAWSPLEPEDLIRRLRGERGWHVIPEHGLWHADRGPERLTLFPDGRLVFGPVDDLERARERLGELLGREALGS